MVYNCKANLSEERHRNRNIATFCQWSTSTSSTPTHTNPVLNTPPQPKRRNERARRRESEMEGGNPHKPSHVSGRATCFTYETHLSPFNSHEIVQEAVIAMGGTRRKWCGTARGAITENPSLHPGHSFGVLPLWKHTLSPPGVKESRLSPLISPFVPCLLTGMVGLILSKYNAAVARCITNRQAGLDLSGL